MRGPRRRQLQCVRSCSGCGSTGGDCCSAFARRQSCIVAIFAGEGPVVRESRPPGNGCADDTGEASGITGFGWHRIVVSGTRRRNSGSVGGNGLRTLPSLEGLEVRPGLGGIPVPVTASGREGECAVAGFRGASLRRIAPRPLPRGCCFAARVLYPFSFEACTGVAGGRGAFDGASISHASESMRTTVRSSSRSSRCRL